MSINQSTESRFKIKSDAVVVFFTQDDEGFKAQRKTLVDGIPHLQPLFDSGDFEGKRLSTAMGYVGSAAASPRFVLLGLGSKDDLTPEVIRRAAAAATKKAASKGCKHVAFEIPHVEGMDVSTLTQSFLV